MMLNQIENLILPPLDMDSYKYDYQEKKKKRKKKKKKKAHRNTDYSYSNEFSQDMLDICVEQDKEGNPPDYMQLTMRRDSGIFFGKGKPTDFYVGIQCPHCYVGKPQDRDGHVLVVGSSGSHKSSGIALPTTETWGGVIVALDVKGEISKHWANIEKPNKRPSKIFSPSKDISAFSTYDPFQYVRQDDEDNLISNIRELTNATVPLSNHTADDFWGRAARKTLTAAFLHYFSAGLEFAKTVDVVTNIHADTLIQKIGTSPNGAAKRRVRSYMANGNLSSSEMFMDIMEELDTRLEVFTDDARILNALTPAKNAINWKEDIDTYNIFLSIPEDKLDQWGSVYSLMLTQLIRTLERRPDKHSPEGQKLPPVLLLLDEFPRIGKMDVIANALSTLRNKNVTICLFIQSLSQLDELYGQYVRRTILDNCTYKVILNVADADSQRYFSELIGTTKTWPRSFGESINPSTGKSSYSRSVREASESIIPPHELAFFDKKMAVLTPEGFCWIEKYPYYEWNKHQ